MAIKNVETDEQLYMARVVVQGHTDKEKGLLVNTVNHIRQNSVRLIVTNAETNGFKLWAKDVSQAYIQADEQVRRNVYVNPLRNSNPTEPNCCIS